MNYWTVWFYCNCIFYSLQGDLQRLFPYAEILEDVAQDLVCGDLTRDLPQVVQYLSYILCQQVGGKGMNALLYLRLVMSYLQDVPSQ